MKKDKIDFVASGIIINKNAVLMIWHSKLKAWLFPGGHIENNETMEEAVIRECKEEINLDTEVFNNKVGELSDDSVVEENLPFCILKEPIKEPNNFHYHIDFIYKLKPKNIEDFNLQPNAKWVKKEDIESLDTFDNELISTFFFV